MLRFSLIHCIQLIASLLVIGIMSSAVHANPVRSLFPIENYDQTVARWIKPESADYDQPLISAAAQEQRLHEFYQHHCGQSSPWNEDYVNRVLRHAPPDDLRTMEKSLLATYSNKNKSEKEMGYGENERPHTLQWIKAIARNIDFDALESPQFRAQFRGIAVDNTPIRALPTQDVHFYHHTIPGQGYPFDNLQMSALWAGTPVYVIAQSKNQAWSLVLTPEVIGWVNSNKIAYANADFVLRWQQAAKNKLAAITRTETALHDDSGKYQLTAYIGSVFPAIDDQASQLMIPARNAEHQAIIKIASMQAGEAAVMPLAATPHHFAMLMQTLAGRPYGWGNLYFYNDCSSELKNLFTPFAIWLPRHSSEQVSRGKMVDLSAATKSQRLAYLKENGRPLMTIVYIGGHVFLYVGNANDARDHSAIVMTYQDMWGLRPESNKRRAVIGQSVFFPLLLQYPEDTELQSQAAKKYFQVAFLDQMPPENHKLRAQLNRFILKTLMFPDFSDLFRW